MPQKATYQSGMFPLAAYLYFPPKRQLVQKHACVSTGFEEDERLGAGGQDLQAHVPLLQQS